MCKGVYKKNQGPRRQPRHRQGELGLGTMGPSAAEGPDLASADGEGPLPEHGPSKAMFSQSTGKHPRLLTAFSRIRPLGTGKSNTESNHHAQGYPGVENSTKSQTHKQLWLVVSWATPETPAESDQRCLKPTVPQPRCQCLLRGVSAGCWSHQGDQPGTCGPFRCSSGRASLGCSGAGLLAGSSWLRLAVCS